MRYRASCLRLVAIIIVAGTLAGCSATRSTWSSEQQTRTVGPVSVSDGAEPQSWLIPSSIPNILMRAELFRPPGMGPFPLAVISHGSDEVASNRARLKKPAFPALTNWLLAQGYAVLVPERPGHGMTGGPYLESQGSCDEADFARAGNAVADSIESSIDYMVKQGFVRQGGVVVIGHSAGGWGALALAGRPRADIGAIVNFAGGRGGRNRGRPNHNCAPERLIDTAGDFGRAARVPTLWLYAENDSFFAPTLARQMVEAFRKHGGRAEFAVLPAITPDGHALINEPPTTASWAPLVATFLDARP